MTHITDDLTIVNRKGLHARASAKFVETLEGFESDVQVERDGMRVTGRSIMGLLMLAASQGTSINVSVDGPDAADCFAAIKTLVDAGFHEAPA